MSSDQPAKPSVNEYSTEEFHVVVQRVRDRGWRVDDVQKRARKIINGKKGRGPHCPECAMKPAGQATVSKHGDWGQVQHYECLACGHEYSGVRRYMYNEE